jgi:predicted branched-subunit amino acid permease
LTHPTRRGEFWAGVKATFPLVVGAIPFGIIFGALATTSGLSAGGALAMSLFVFAGSSQFIAAKLIATGTGAVLIILTTFVVNLRHAHYAASLAPYMKHLPQRWLLQHHRATPPLPAPDA